MTQEKIIRFIKTNGEQMVVIRIPPFATMQEEFDYYQWYWADAATIKLYKEAFYKMEFIKSNPVFEQMQLLWLLSETEKLATSLKFSHGEKNFLYLLVQGKSVKEIAITFFVLESTVSNCVARMNNKAGLMTDPSALKLAEHFLTIIYS